MADIHFHPFIAVLHPVMANSRFYPFSPIRHTRRGCIGFADFTSPIALPPFLFHVFLIHEKKTFFSYQRLTRSGGVGQGRAILRAAQRAKRLDGRWSGGYIGDC